MAGGTWAAQNKVLPGVYINLKASGYKHPDGTTGVVGLAVTFPWLQSHTILSIYPEQLAAMVADYGDTYTTTLQEAFKNATEVLLYRLNEGVKAALTIGSLKATAKHTGTFGNRLSVSINAVAAESGWFYVITYLDGKELEIQKVSSAKSVKSNQWIDFEASTDTIAAAAGGALVGGTDGDVTNADYTGFLAALELEDFNAVACTSGDASLIALFVAYAKRLRNEEGKYVQAVVPDTTGIDCEYVFSVRNGVILKGGKTIDKVVATAYVAGATAAAPLTGSLTNAEYVGAVDVTERFTNSQQEALARSGQLVFVPNGKKIVIQKDISTLTTFDDDRTYAWSKGKILRTMDAVCNTIRTKGNNDFIGKVQNNVAGRELFKATILAYFRSLEAQGVLKDVTPDDITVAAGNTIDSVVVQYIIRPVDTMDIIYNTIVVEA